MALSKIQDKSLVLSYVTATGGSIATSGNFKIHTFTSNANFVVTNTGLGSNSVDYFMVAGGGSGGAGSGGFGPGGGGGGGGFLTAVGLSISTGTLPVVVGARR